MTGAVGGFSDLFAANGFQTATPKALVYGGPVTSSSTASLTLKPVEIDWPTSGLDFADID